MIGQQIQGQFLQPMQPFAPLAAPPPVQFGAPPALLAPPPPPAQQGGQEGGGAGTDAIMKIIAQMFGG